MDNVLLMNKVRELATEHLVSRDDSMRVMEQIAVIRKAFGVKNDEHDLEVTSYDRKRVQSDEDIFYDFSYYPRLIELNEKMGRGSVNTPFIYSMQYYIAGVRFFDEALADKLQLKYDTIIQEMKRGEYA